mgnify:CR=1 FL=1
MTRYTSDAQSMAMQREALRRVREQQQRARQAVEGAPAPAPEAKSIPAQEETPGPVLTAAPPQSEPSPLRPQAAVPRGRGPNGPRRMQNTGFGPQQSMFSMPAAAPGAAQPQKRDLRSLLDSFLRRESPGGESLSSLGQGLRDTLGSVAEPVEGLLDSLGIGGEELIILMVMYLVFREKGDKTLLLALGYLLL